MYDHVFISDTHLGSQFTKTALLENFLKGLSLQTKELWLIGDIFDIWKTDTKDTSFVAFQSFPSVHYLIGNHDLWIKNLSFLTPNIQEFKTLEYRGLKLLAHHGHTFDPSFGQSSYFNTLLDSFLYSLSKLLRWDIRTTFHFLTEKHYKGISSVLEAKMQAQQTLTPFDILICGHTHCPESKRVNNFHVFNLGSWIQKPFAFFIKEGEYAFIEITKDKLCPKEEDFNDLRRLGAT